MNLKFKTKLHKINVIKSFIYPTFSFSFSYKVNHIQYLS